MLFRSKDDKDEIEAKTQALTAAAHKLAEQMYAQEQAKQQQAPGADSQTGGEQKKDDDNVVDAEYEEVKDKK